MYQYVAFGLVIQTPMPCPLLPKATGTPDIRVSYGQVPHALPVITAEGVCFQANAEEVLIRLPSGTAFWLKGGQDVVIAQSTGFGDDAVRLFLFGLVMGVVLLQRGELVLHASAVQVGNFAIAFMGHSGAGKSTLVAALLHRGYRVLADEVCVIREGVGGQSMAIPATPYLQLWEHALPHIWQTPPSLQRVRPEIQKYHYPLDQNAFQAEPLPLRRLYALEGWNKAIYTCKPVQGTQHIQKLLGYTYHVEYLKGLGAQALHFKQCAALASRTVLRTVRYSSTWVSFPEVLDLLEQDMQHEHMHKVTQDLTELPRHNVY